MNRRRFLTSLAASAAVGCAGGEGDCPETAEQIEGPFYLDAQATRIDITEGKAGIALTLLFTVVDTDCNPIPDAEVDVWQADADGVYSGYAEMDTEGETFLRGVQLTTEGGECQIETIFPGFYTGRTSHIHVRVSAVGFEDLVTQLYFSKVVITTVAPEYPAINEYTTNIEDAFYDADNEMAIEGDPAAGYEAVYVLTLMG
ncbi:MAG: protocatechuate 3,4-dioxygenase beta subunit [Myxococcota bacterium]|jgi:protocatechuate 3,4-dioxygenase beta subunit